MYEKCILKVARLLIAGSIVICFASCKTTFFAGTMGNAMQTRVDLSQANFQTLGSFTGVAMAKKEQISIKGDIGLLAKAKADLLKNAAAKGVQLNGSRTLTNVTIDKVENKKHVVVTVSAEIIEFK